MIGNITVERRQPMIQPGRREEDHRLTNIESQLASQADWLKSISETMTKIAVQDNKIKNLDKELTEVKKDCKGCQQETKLLSAFQQTCPRAQVKYLWLAIAVPMWLLLVGAIWNFFFSIPVVG